MPYFATCSIHGQESGHSYSCCVQCAKPHRGSDRGRRTWLAVAIFQSIAADTSRIPGNRYPSHTLSAGAKGLLTQIKSEQVGKEAQRPNSLGSFLFHSNLSLN